MRSMALVPALALATCGLASCLAPPAAPPTSLRVGYAHEPPYAFVLEGRVTGESPELFRLVSRALGITDLQWIPMEFDRLVPALLDGRVDVVAAGLFQTPERARHVRFSVPTFCVGLYAVTVEHRGLPVPGGHPVPRSHPPIDLLGTMESLGVLSGAVEAGLAAGWTHLTSDLVEVPDVATARAGLLGGHLDAFLISGPTARYMVESSPSGALGLAGPLHPETGAPAHPQTALTPPEDGLQGGREPPPSHGCGGFAFRPGDRDLAVRVDSILHAVVGSPGHLQLVEPFGFTPTELLREGPG